MHLPIKADRRLLSIAASVLLTGAALAATAAPAHATPAAAVTNTVTVTPPADQSSPLDTAVDLPVSATETDQTATLQFTVTGLPTGFAISQPTVPGDATVDITGTFSAPFTGTVQVTALDPVSGATDTASFAWTTAANTVTFPTPATAQSTHVGTAVTPFTIAATDTDAAATLTYTATLPPGITIDPASGQISGTPTAPGLYQSSVTATDQSGATATSNTFIWNIVANTVTVSAPATRDLWVGVAFSVQPTATDSDQSLTTFQWSVNQHPAGVSINPATGLISGRPKVPDNTHSVVTATDATGSSGLATIHWVIRAPVTIINPGVQKTTAGQWTTLAPITVTDAVAGLGDKLTIHAFGVPAGMTFQPSTMLLSGWPERAGTYYVRIFARGTLGTASEMTLKVVVRRAPDKGATGQIRLPFAGKCLQDPGNRRANGTRVVIANCVPGSTERWTIASDGTIRVNGRCLDIAGRGGSAGRQLQLWGCENASPRQTWLQGTAGELVNPASGLCVTDPGSSRRNGTVVRMGACRVKGYEQWQLPAQPVLTALGGSCADDHYSGGANGNVIDMFWCNGTAGQAWSFQRDHTIRISLYSNKCLTVRNGKIVIWTCSARNRAQHWNIIQTGGLGSQITLGNGVCLAIPSMTAQHGTALETNGAQLITARCARTDPRDLWHIG